MLLFLLCLTSSELGVTLSEEVLGLDKIIACEDGFFALDRRESAVFWIGKQGTVRKSYAARGSGPGEYYKLTSIVLTGNVLYLADLMGKVIVLDRNL